jgi:hypothetical protein
MLGYGLEGRIDRGGHQPARDSSRDELAPKPSTTDPASLGSGLGPPAGERLVVQVATRYEVSDDGLGDIGRSATTTETARELLSAPGFSREQIEGGQGRGLLIERRLVPAPRGHRLPGRAQPLRKGEVVLARDWATGCGDAWGDGDACQVISPVERMPLTFKSKSSGLVAASRAVS